MRKVIFFSALFLTEVTAQAQMSFVKTVSVTSAVEGGSARPEIVATANRVFVLYLGDITTGTNRTFKLKIYDRNLDTVIVSRVLVSTTSGYGGPTDIRVASDGQYLFAFYETHQPTSPTAATTYLWAAQYTLDDSFGQVAHTSTPITSSKPLSELQDGGELLDDPAPVVGPHSVFVVTRLKYSLAIAGRTTYRVREFSKNDLAKLSEFDLDLSTVADGRGRVTSLLFWNSSIHIALATTVSDQGVSENNDDGALSNIILVRMRDDWTFDAQNSVRIISAEPNDRENYVSGLKTDGVHFYVTYKQAVGSPPSGEQIAWIKIFDKDFMLIHKERVRSTKWGPGGGEMRPSLEVRDTRIFSGQSTGESLGSGNAEVSIYEMATTSVGDNVAVPKGFFLSQNYPNPFNLTTTIRFRIADIGLRNGGLSAIENRKSQISLNVFDILGREVATLVDGQLNAGEHSVQFDAEHLPSGVYFYQLLTGSGVHQRKMTVLK